MMTETNLLFLWFSMGFLGLFIIIAIKYFTRSSDDFSITFGEIIMTIAAIPLGGITLCFSIFYFILLCLVLFSESRGRWFRMNFRKIKKEI